MSIKYIIIIIFGIILFVGQTVSQEHKDYVPDEKTAIKIAEAVLIGQFGEAKVKEQMPLSGKLNDNIWLVQGLNRKIKMMGGNYGIWINKYSGCIEQVAESMK